MFVLVQRDEFARTLLFKKCCIKKRGPKAASSRDVGGLFLHHFVSNH